MSVRKRYHGVAAEYETPGQIMEAAERARQAGYTRMDAYTPFPIHGMSDIVGFRDERVPIAMFLAALAGAGGGLLLQAYTNGWDYPVNVGGKPLVSYAAAIPVTFECTILLSALTGAIGMLAMNGLPKPYDPIFNAPNFERASQDRFFLCIESTDPNFNLEEVTSFLEGTDAITVSAVEN